MPSLPSSTGSLAAAACARVGTIVDGRWQIEALIAVGGSSAIYAASHRNGLRVAMKVLDSELADNATAVSHFLREGRAVNSIHHPGVVNVLDEGTTGDGAPFLLMPLLEGETAQQRLARHPDGLPADEALAIVEVVLEILGAAHARGIVHRDLKPDNVFLEKSGAVRVLDFGVAHVVNSFEHTQHGTVVGTAGYLPPEQARGRVSEAGPRSDLWSAGAMLYTLLTSRVLHEAGTVIASVLRAQHEVVPPARVLVAGVPDLIAHVLDGALAFDASDRWMDAAAMRAAVRAALDELRRAPASGHYRPHGALGSCAGVTVESLAPRSAASDAPLALEGARAARDPLRATRKPLAWIAAVCVAAAWVLVAAFVSQARPAAPIVVAAAAAPAELPAPEPLAPLALAQPEPAPRAPPAAPSALAKAAPAGPKGPFKARELVRQPDF